MESFPPESERQIYWIKFLVFPWLALPAFVTAVSMSVLYRPPFIPVAIVLVTTLLGGAGYAYGCVTGSKRLAYGAMTWVLPVVIIVNMHEQFHQDARFYTILAWFAFGLLAPMWIWRKRGLERFAPSETAGGE